MRISDWSSDVCSSDLLRDPVPQAVAAESGQTHQVDVGGVVAVLQQADEAAEGGCGDGIVEGIERVGSGRLIVAAGHRLFPSSMNSYTAIVLARRARHAKHTVKADRQAEQSWIRGSPPAGARCV